MPKLTRTTALHFREELRAAREAVLQDAERFVQVIHAIERLGSYLNPVEDEPEKKFPGLYLYGFRVAKLVKSSPLASGNPPWQPDFCSIYKSVREARNDAIHQGAFARHLAANTVKLAIVLEDALLAVAIEEELPMDKIDVYMVRNPVIAHLWQPIAHVRQTMLENSFSYLPLYDKTSEGWKLVSDYGIARFLDGVDRKKRLAISLEDAVAGEICKLELIPTEHFHVSASKSSVIQKCKGYPVVVVHKEDVSLALGIVTPFDLI
ncbi:MAG TPA: hypothetical protein VFT74_03705 [Isosphaeraceae bacterium]|nr:hypothetical protein [Isosphaeraceae bacterium]